MTKHPLVSVVVITKNSECTIRKCIESIRNQTCRSIEIILVDNYSTDATVEIASQQHVVIYQKGPERSTQRNFGASKSHGEYILFLDSDAIAPENLVQHCINIFDKESADVVLIPYISIGEGYWTKCRCFEALFYQTREFSMPRFFKREKFLLSGGFCTTLNAGEDMELYLRLINLGFKVIPSKLKLTHLEKTVSLTDLLRKDVWAMPYVSKYLRKRSTYNIKHSSSRFPLAFISKTFSLRRQLKYLPGLALLKFIDYFIVLLSWIMK